MSALFGTLALRLHHFSKSGGWGPVKFLKMLPLFIAVAVVFLTLVATPGASAQQAWSAVVGAVGQPGSADGLTSLARFSNLQGMAVDSGGNIYVADTQNHTIRKVSSSGSVSTFAGSAGEAGEKDGSAADARFRGGAERT